MAPFLVFLVFNILFLTSAEARFSSRNYETIRNSRRLLRRDTDPLISTKKPIMDLCPALPLDLCDFYFQDNEGNVPTFSLPKSSTDIAISPRVIDSHSLEIMTIEATGKGAFLSTDRKKSSAGLQFYISRQKSKIMARPLDGRSRSFFEDRCVILPVSSALVETGAKSLKLKLGDENQKLYPDARRCVVFKTGPYGPPLGSRSADA